MEFYLKGKFENGELVILNPELVRHFFITQEGTRCEVTVKPYKKMISAAQMRWYRGIAINTIIEGIKKQTGEICSADDIHAYNIAKIMKPKIRTKEILGETIVETTKFSMRDMTKPEFEWFKNALQHMWSLKGIDIKDPNEDNFLNDENGIGSIRNFKKK